jgi:putative thioredoxin
MSEKSPWIVETSQETFQHDVIDRSADVPVVVDFWAEWCQPCRLLGPLLEKLVDEHQGKFVLVKANAEQMPDVAASFGVSSIPAVFALREGKIADQFLGLLPEPQIRAWLERLLPGEAENLAAEARLLEPTDPEAAEARYREALEMMPSESSAKVGLARMLLAQDRLEEGCQVIGELAAAGVLDAEGEQLQAELVIRLEGTKAGDVGPCRAAAEAAPDDLPLQLMLAKSQAAGGEHEEAMQICVDLIQRDRQGQGEPARELMVYVFHVLGPESEVTAQYRRKLTMALY